jgi:type II secretory pathway pseudopilin PulG
LPFYGRALFVCIAGGIILSTFLVSTIVALFETTPVSLRFWSVISAAETAAWRLKWIALPVTVLTIWAGSLLCASIRRNPKRFAGNRIAHGGLSAVVLVAVMIATFIGITIPERLRQRERGNEAATSAQLYTIQRAMLDYRITNGTLPATLDELRTLPDADGSISAALKDVDSSAYSPGADMASLPKKKARSLRGAALRNATLRSTDDAPDGEISFTKYELRLQGEDKKLGTADDWIMRDGVIIKPVESEEQAQLADTENKP